MIVGVGANVKLLVIATAPEIGRDLGFLAIQPIHSGFPKYQRGRSDRGVGRYQGFEIKRLTPETTSH